MRKFILITKEEELREVTGLTNDGLWEQGVVLDDWDYFIVVKTKDKPSEFIGSFKPKNEGWDCLLSGCCSNGWYHIESPKGYFYIGGAYHS